MSMTFDSASNPYASRVPGASDFGVHYVKGSWSAEAFRGAVGFYGDGNGTTVAAQPQCEGLLCAEDVEFGVIVKQENFFDSQCDEWCEEARVCHSCYSCILGMAYSRVWFVFPPLRICQ